MEYCIGFCCFVLAGTHIATWHMLKMVRLCTCYTDWLRWLRSMPFFGSAAHASAADRFAIAARVIDCLRQR